MLSNYKNETKKIIFLFFITYFLTAMISLLLIETDIPNITLGENNFSFFVKVLFNNLLVFTILCSGSFFTKYLTYLVIISNAYLLGVNTPLIITLKFSSLAIFSHGIVEFSGFYLGALIGLKSVKYHTQNKKNTEKIISIAILIIFLGAFIEAYISPSFL